MTASPLVAEIPSSEHVPLPSEWMMTTFRSTAQRLLRWHFSLEVRGAEHVPAQGPVVIAANHVGFADGPLMAAMAPRPVHVLTKTEMFTGRLGRFLTAAGQVPVDRYQYDLAAIRTSLRVLRAGRVLGLFPEGNRGGGEVLQVRPGAAYFGIVTGAPVVPLAFLGTRLPGGGLESVPPRGSRMVLAFGPPVRFERHGWPRTRAELAEGGERVRAHLAQLVAEAQRSTGMSLPGPVPGEEPSGG